MKRKGRKRRIYKNDGTPRRFNNFSSFSSIQFFLMKQRVRGGEEHDSMEKRRVYIQKKWGEELGVRE